MKTKEPLSSEMLDYRRTLQAAENASHTEYDKAVLTLSGGALAITFALFKELGRGGMQHPQVIIVAWIAWCSSLSAILMSFYTAGKANRIAIQQLDRNSVPSTTGGAWNRLTRFLNFTGGFCFLLGLVFAIWFVSGILLSYEQRPTTSPASTSASASASTVPSTRAAPAAAPTTARPQ